tara:strand:+ start:7208 stop:7399 length:192 start_codon:yes stop_codon:yes gene_type:complete
MNTILLNFLYDNWLFIILTIMFIISIGEIFAIRRDERIIEELQSNIVERELENNLHKFTERNI